MIERYYYKQNWEVKTFDRGFITKAFGKTHMLFNNRAINNKEVKKYETIDEKYFDINVLLKKQHLNLVNELIQTLTFKDEDNEFTDNELSGEKFEKKATKAIKLLNKESNRTLLGIAKTKEITTNKQFLGTMNTILKNYGFKIEIARKGKQNLSYYTLKQTFEHIIEAKDN